jgi:coenzyme F420-reducing hydrogenase delta subunit
LAFSGIEQDRLRVKWISSAEGPKFAEEIRDFVQILRALGASPLRHERSGKRAA